MPKKIFKSGNDYYIDWIRSEVSKFEKGTVLVLDLKRHKNKRSIPQNSYLWGVVYKVIGDELGYDVNDIHEYCKDKFLPKRELTNKITGEIFEAKESTSKMDKENFSKYLEGILFWASNELNIYVPDANSFASYEIINEQNG